MEKIDCLVCGKSVKFREYIDAEDYDGEVVCQECGSLLHVKLANSKVQRYKVVKKYFRQEKSEEEIAYLNEIWLKVVQERRKQLAKQQPEENENG